MINLAVSLILAYLIGSIPTRFIFAKVIKRIDIRRHGSGNVGATNTFRTVGKIPALLVLIIDILKGFIPVAWLSGYFFNAAIDSAMGPEVYRILLGGFAVGGHVWSAFLKFKGGKGVATAAGALLALAPKALLFSAVVWISIFTLFKIVSVASIIASVALPVFTLLFYDSTPLTLFTVLLCLGSTYKHKSNIQRLIRGEEKKLF